MRYLSLTFVLFKRDVIVLTSILSFVFFKFKIRFIYFCSRVAMVSSSYTYRTISSSWMKILDENIGWKFWSKRDLYFFLKKNILKKTKLGGEIAVSRFCRKQKFTS